MPASKKTRALLALLVVSQRAFRRERLCDLLWQGPDDPRAALRWSLAKIRPLLDEPGVTRLVAERDEVRFEPCGITTDLHVLRALQSAGIETASTEQLQAAIELVQGELLDGLELCDCHQYHEWYRAEREAARRLAVCVRMALVERLDDDPDAALGHARSVTAADPLDQDGHAAVIRILGKLGRIKDAIEQYETCKRIQRSELQSEPSALVERARMELNRPRSPARITTGHAEIERRALASPATVTRVAQRIAPHHPLIGREAERQQLQRFAASLGHTETELLLLLGEPGVGKSRLLSELASIVGENGGRVLMGRAFEAEMVRPYGAWLDALRMLDPELLESVAPIDEQYSFAVDLTNHRGRFFELVAERLRRLGASGAETVIVFDDIQWLDEASAALLHFACRALAGSPVRFACAARPGELGDNFPVLRVLRAIMREGGMHQLVLAPLDAENTARLVEAELPGADAARVFAESGGNPLYALEVTRALTNGKQTTHSLHTLLQDRLAQLQSTSRALVNWASVFGGAFSLATLQAVAGLGTSELLAALEELERHGFLRLVELSHGAPGYDFVHDLMRSAAYQCMSEPKRRLMHLAVARALSGLPDPTGAQAGDIAHHAEMGDDARLAARYGLIAAERSLRLFAAHEAVELAERALIQTARLEQTERAALDIRLLRVLIVCDGSRRRSRELEKAMRHALSQAQTGVCEKTVTLGLLAMAHLHFELGDFESARQLSLRVSDAGRQSHAQHAVQSLAHAAHCLAMVEREMDKAEAFAAEARAVADQLHGELEVFVLLVAEGFIHHFNGRLDHCAVALEHATVLAEQQGVVWLGVVSLLRLALCELQRGQPRRALENCSRLQNVVGCLGEGSEGAYGEVIALVARRDLGEPEANQSLEQALGKLRALDAQAYLADAYCLVAESDVKVGDFNAALSRARDALVSAEVVNRPTAAIWAHAISAHTHLLLDDTESARRQLDMAHGLMAGAGRVSAWARARLTAVSHLLAADSVSPSRLSIN